MLTYQQQLYLHWLYRQLQNLRHPQKPVVEGHSAKKL